MSQGYLSRVDFSPAWMRRLFNVWPPFRAAGIRVVGAAVVAEGKGQVTLYAGQRKLTLKWSDLVEYGGNRATRGGLLPQGLRRVERIETTG